MEFSRSVFTHVSTLKLVNCMLIKKRHSSRFINLLLIAMLPLFSNNVLAAQSPVSSTVGSPLVSKNTKEAQRLKDKIRKTNESITTQNEERTALKTQLLEMEKEIQQLLKQNTEKDAEIDDLKKEERR